MEQVTAIRNVLNSWSDSFHNALSRNQRAWLIALFALCFSLPPFGLWYYQTKHSPPKSAHATDPLDHFYTPIHSPRQLLEFSGTEGLNPPRDKDLLITSWVRFRSLPPAGERLVLWSKADLSNRAQGFALGLSNDQGVMRPMVSWTADGGARWYRFSEITLQPERWTLFALSIRDQRFIGLFTAQLGEDPRPHVQVLGGHDVGGFAADSAALLRLVPPLSGRFVSAIGPMAMIRQSNVRGDERSMVESMVKNPTGVPDVSDTNLMLWWPGQGGARGFGERKLYPLVVGSQGGD